jgi:hypothetical protein
MVAAATMCATRLRISLSLIKCLRVIFVVEFKLKIAANASPSQNFPEGFTVR